MIYKNMILPILEYGDVFIHSASKETRKKLQVLQYYITVHILIVINVVIYMQFFIVIRCLSHFFSFHLN